MSTRRPHTKSRLGCAQCKSRRVKCDLGVPACSNCVRRKEECSHTEVHTYVLGKVVPSKRPHEIHEDPVIDASHDSPSSTNETHHRTPRPPEWRRYDVVDIDLTHFYSAYTSSTIMSRPAAMALWRNEVFDLSLSQPIVLDALLATAAMHKRVVAPAVALQRGYPGVITSKASAMVPYLIELLKAPSEHNCATIFVGSILLTIWSFAAWQLPLELDQIFPSMELASRAGSSKTPALDTLINTVSFCQGILAIAAGMAEELRKQGFQPCLDSPDFEPLPKIDAEIEEHLRKLRDRIRSKYGERISEEQAVSLEIYLEPLERIGMMFQIADDPDWRDIVIGWATRLPKEFTSLLIERDPAALAMLAYWAGSMHNEDRWWLRGWPRALFADISNIIDEDWKMHLEFPSKFF